ncbi:hypothetical protein GC176_14275 [bacterium]|nr:hypothetical protein [bacterium]
MHVASHVVSAVALFICSDLPQGELADRVTSARASFQSGTVEFEVRRFDVSDQSTEDSDGTIIAKYHCSFDSKHLRTDLSQSRTVPQGVSAGEATYVTKRQILSDTALISHSTELSRGLPLAVRIDREQPLEQLKQKKQIFILDPRVIGIYPVNPGLLHHFRGRAVPISPEFSRAVSIEVEEDQELLYRIAIQYPNGITATYWISPSMGYNIVRASTTLKDNKGTLTDNMTVRLREYENVSNWFPDEVETRRNRNGTLVSRQLLTITHATFNRIIDENQEFSLAGLEVPPGVEIYENPPNVEGVRIWDGEKITLAAANPKRIGLRPGAVVVNKKNKLWTYIIVVHLVLLGVAFIFLYSARKRSTRNRNSET